MMVNKHHDESKAKAEAKDEAELKTENKDGEEGELWDGDTAQGEADAKYQNTLHR